MLKMHVAVVSVCWLQLFFFLKFHQYSFTQLVSSGEKCMCVCVLHVLVVASHVKHLLGSRRHVIWLPPGKANRLIPLRPPLGHGAAARYVTENTRKITEEEKKKKINEDDSAYLQR